MIGSAGRAGRRRWLRRVLAGAAALLLVVMLATLYVAYVWHPPEVSGYRSLYLARVGPRQVQTPVARFSCTRSGSGPPQGYTTATQDGFRYDLQAMAGALGSFLDAVGLRRAALVDHSWGGAVALYFAERQPQRVDKLALLASPGLDVPSSPDWRPLELPVVGELVGKLMDRQAMERTLRKSFAHGKRVTAELVEENWAPLSRRDNRMAMWLQQRRFDYAHTEQRLGNVRVPTLILWGDADRFDHPWQGGCLRPVQPGRAHCPPGVGKGQIRCCQSVSRGGTAHE